MFLQNLFTRRPVEVPEARELLSLRDTLALEAPPAPRTFSVVPPLSELPPSAGKLALAIADEEDRELALAWLRGKVQIELPEDLQFISEAQAARRDAIERQKALARAHRDAAWRYAWADAMIAERAKRSASAGKIAERF